MRKLAYIVFMVTMFYCYGTSLAQESSVREVFDKVTRFYKNQDSYRIEMAFSMVRGLSGNDITESYKATMEKSGSYGRNLFLDSEIHRFSNAQITVDTKNRTVTLSELGPEQNSPAEISTLLEYYTKSQLVDAGPKEWICELVSERNNFSQLPYGKIEVYVNKDDFSVSKQVLYFSNLVPFSDKESGRTVQDYGRLIIAMEHDLDNGIPEKRLQDFIVEKANQDKRLVGPYATYQFIDKTK